MLCRQHTNVSSHIMFVFLEDHHNQQTRESNYNGIKGGRCRQSCLYIEKNNCVTRAYK